MRNPAPRGADCLACVSLNHLKLFSRAKLEYAVKDHSNHAEKEDPLKQLYFSGNSRIKMDLIILKLIFFPVLQDHSHIHSHGQPDIYSTLACDTSLKHALIQICTVSYRHIQAVFTYISLTNLAPGSTDESVTGTK